MTDLNANVSAGQEWLPLTDADSRTLEDGYYTIDSENVKVENGPHPATSLSISPYNGRRAQRGVGGSTAASHSSGATLTRYYPDAASGGGGSLNVDNTVDPPEAVTTIIAPGAVVGGGEADLSAVVTIFTASVTLTDAQIKALPSTPVEIVPAPGADKAIIPVTAVAMSEFSADDYTNVNVEARMFLDWDAGPVASTKAWIGNGTWFDAWGGPGGAEIFGFILAPSLAIRGTTVVSTTGQQDITNTGLNLGATNGVDGNFTGGNAANTLKVTIWYSVMDL